MVKMYNIFSRVFYFCKPYTRDLFIVFLALLATSLSSLYIGILIKAYIDHGINISNQSSLNSTVIKLASIIFLFVVGSFFRSYFINNTAEKVINKIKILALNNILHLGISEFEQYQVGDFVNRLTTDLEQISKLITNFLSFFIRNSIMLMGALILMFSQSIKLSLLTMIVIPALLFPLFKLAKSLKELTKKNSNIKNSFTSELIEVFSNMRIIHAFNKQNNQIDKLTKQLEEYNKISSYRLLRRSIFFALAIGVILLSILCIIWLGSIDIIENKISAGAMTSFIYYAIVVAVSGTSIAELFSDLTIPISAAENVFNLINTTKYQQEKLLDKVHTIEFFNKIDLKNISFAYPSREKLLVLDNINLILKKGFIGITGSSGSGKSTILQLLLKFYRPINGQIFINDIDINNIDTNYLRSLMAYVPQEAGILSGTIRENITFGNQNATTEQIEKIVNITGVDQIIKQFVDGLDTKIGNNNSVQLSGGQKQRIAIARALITNPKVLLLDEATNALDRESEKQLLHNIKQFMQERFVIMVTHRIENLEYANHVIIINNAKLIAKGTHAELLRTSPYYRYLYEERLMS